MIRPQVPIALILLSFAVLAGCGSQDGAEDLSPVAKAPAGLSDTERSAMTGAAREFAQDVRSGRADSVAERFDLEAVVRGICQGTGVSKSVREGYAKGFEDGLADRTGGLMADYMGNDVRFLRLVEVDGSTQMLFRVWAEEEGIDYLRCAFDRADANGWKLVDIFSYTGGEAFTATMRRTYLPLLAGGDRVDALRAEYEPLAEVVDLMAADDATGARKALAALPETLAEQRFAKVLELQVLAAIEESADEYATTVEAFEKRFPGDPSLPLWMLEVHSIRGEHRQALARIDQLEKMLGGDPFLHFMRVSALVGEGRSREAIAGLQEAIAAEPEIEALRWALVSAALPEGEFAVVGEALRALRRDFDYDLDAEELLEREEYEAFLASPEGEALVGELPVEPVIEPGDCN